MPARSPWDGDHFSPDDGQPTRKTIVVPEWANDAWQAMVTDPDLANAVFAHHEGLRLFQQHPSFALIAFVGCIEAIGAKLRKLKRCKECNAQIGAAERFRSALRLVRGEAETRLLSKAYRPRSETAHAGRLHGSEPMFGAFTLRLGFFTADPVTDFTWRLVYPMRNASRDLLQLVFTQGLPEPADAESERPANSTE